MLDAGCSGLDALNPICQVGSLGGSIAASGFESVLDGISQWVASGAEWLLGQIGDVLVSTTTIDVGATWFRTHYGQMTALAGVVILPLLLVSTLQAVLRQNPGQLVRTFLVQLPLALLLAVVAIQIVILSLSATDAMSTAIAGGTAGDVTSLLSGVSKGLVVSAADPTPGELRAAPGRPPRRRGRLRALAGAPHQGGCGLRGRAVLAAWPSPRWSGRPCRTGAAAWSRRSGHSSCPSSSSWRH